MSGLRINIHGCNDHNVINEKEYPKFKNTLIHLKAEGGSLAFKNVRIVFEPSAVKPLFENISWDTKYKYGDVEQAGILIGHYYRDCSARNEVIWADVVMIVPAAPALVNASFDTIDITTNAWKKMYEDAEEFRRENMQIVGWYHTHLNHISTRFSGLDRNTQRKAFTYKYSFGVVFNPNQRKWSVFFGPESRECIGELVFDEELSIKYGKPQITIRQVNGDSKLQEDGLVMHFDEKQLKERKVIEYIDDNILSLSQLVGQFFNGVAQLITKTKKYGESYSDELLGRTRVSRSFSEDCNIQQKYLDQRINFDVSKSEIPNSEKVKCIFYSMSIEDEFVSYPNFKCTIKKDFIEEIIKYKQSSLEDPFRKQLLWGYMRKSGSDMDLSRVLSEKEANARIIFSKENKNEEIKELIAMGIQKSSKTNIEYIVIIDNENPQSINTSVIHYSRGNII